MKNAFCISSIASNQGKTLLSIALMYHFRTKVRAYKCGPDFIDPQFHQKITSKASINLDGFMLNQEQLKWMFLNYFDKDIAIVEGVMGFYDGMDKNSSAYDITKTLQIPTILVMDGSGSYITLSAVIQGLKEYKKDNTIVGVIFNKLSSKSHYELIKKHLPKDIKPLGWIKKELKSISSIHLGLDLNELNSNLKTLSTLVLENLDIDELLKITTYKKPKLPPYPFKPIKKVNLKCAVVYDENFSFLYHDNFCYLKEKFKEVIKINSIKNETIPNEYDIVIIPGGYVETQSAYEKIKNSNKFKTSLVLHAKKDKFIYAECAGLIYLGKKIDDKELSDILDITFMLEDKRQRLGYYYAKEYDTNKTYKGHAFHYSKVVSSPKGSIGLYKTSAKNIKDGGWIEKKIYATYLHTIWRESEVIDNLLLR
jgi:cobyrinic acid a,c-diamide synthase